jgi:two-component system nitrate/nitrite response regulator NarL
MWAVVVFCAVLHKICNCWGHDMTTLLLCELSEIVAAGIEAVVKQAACKVLACCRTSDEMLRMAELHRPEMILASSSALGEEAIATIGSLRAENRRPQIIILIDTNPGPTAATLAEFKVDGLLLKHASSATLLECIKSVQQGRTWLDPNLFRHLAHHEHTAATPDILTAREREIMHLVALGMSNKDIAREAKLTEGTVKMYLHHILVKLRLANRTQLATYAHARSERPSNKFERPAAAPGLELARSQRPPTVRSTLRSIASASQKASRAGGR